MEWLLKKFEMGESPWNKDAVTRIDKLQFHHRVEWECGSHDNQT